MSKVISVQDQTYRDLAQATGKLMQTTRQPSSLSAVVGLSVVLMDAWLQKVEHESAKDPKLREQLANAVKSKDREKLKRLFIEALKE